MRLAILLFSITISIVACRQDASKSADFSPMNIATSQYGFIDSTPIQLYTLSDQEGTQISITNYGGIIQSWKTPNKDGEIKDVVMGFDSLDTYLEPHPYFGSIVGRYANRIAEGRFDLDGITYTLATNNGPNHLHGGLKGLDKAIWKVDEVTYDSTESKLVLSHTSPHLDEGYPGQLHIVVSYTLQRGGRLRIDYHAKSDRSTYVNLTNHSYFNLGGHASGSILDHQLQIHSRSITPVNELLIPAGEYMHVEGGPFDFNTPESIGARIDDEHQQIGYGGGYDHNFVIDQPGLDEAIAIVSSPITGIRLRVFTSEPGVQLYTGNFLDGTLVGKGNTTYMKRSGFCLETQHFPDSPNQPEFPSTLLLPDQVYESTTIYQIDLL